MKVNALFNCRSTKSWEWSCWVVCRICLAKVSGHSLSPWRGVCEFSILIPECNRASPWLENCWGIEARSITPPSGLSGRFTCGWAQAAHWWRKKAWKVLKTMRDMLMFEASWWCSDHINVARSLRSLKGIFILVLAYCVRHSNTVVWCLKSCGCWIAPAVYARNICSSLYGKNPNIKSDNLKQHCPMNDPQLGQPLWFTLTSTPTE